ncbi:hypothetical protein [Pseudorhizobium pelagicum]|uniref:Uncharacterized protein n=1 Tax=Pseudorhizobium pelagicum TaxID=1509405 RepID=A0A922NYR5_9HYPH|nr:hypothetical protein [Pseudorhizobium pelagicum]KEQ05739.1 hypothetical protein GV67_04075 [Pseudorhizobium pelagicum]KEQ06419.1 hypothetical protein GV68_07070 [Pseudorhizobium pelagicum]
MRKIGIQELLAWAFTQELPKIGAAEAIGPGYSQAWSMMSEVATLGTLVDRSPNAFGVIPDFIYGGDPHPDAVMVGEAVHRLADRGGYDIPEGWNPFPEWQDEHGLIAAEVRNVVEHIRARPEQVSGRHVAQLVTTAAVLGRGPDWAAAEPMVQMVSVKGKPLWFVQAKARDSLNRVYWFEDNGMDRKTHRPKPGAYRKYQLGAPLRGAIIDRLDWQLWQDALVSLQNELCGRLSAADLLPFHPVRRPWARQMNSAVFPQAVDAAE